MCLLVNNVYSAVSTENRVLVCLLLFWGRFLVSDVSDSNHLEENSHDNNVELVSCSTAFIMGDWRERERVGEGWRVG